MPKNFECRCVHKTAYAMQFELKAYSTRLLGGRELPIAVVHSHNTVRLLTLDHLHRHVNLCYVQSWPQCVPTGPLNESHLGFCKQCSVFV